MDNSVVSGMFDAHMPERVAHMHRFWQAVIDGDFYIIVSDVLDEEHEKSPQQTRDFFATLPKSQVERVVSSKESDNLVTHYIGAEVITGNHRNDCKHIALATINHADAVVSWNCDDMLNPNRIPKYNEVNKKYGYPEIEILTPNKFMEVFYGTDRLE